MRKTLTICIAAILLMAADNALAVRKLKVRRQKDPQKELKDKLNNYFTSYRPSSGQIIRSSAHLQQLIIND